MGGHESTEDFNICIGSSVLNLSWNELLFEYVFVSNHLRRLKKGKKWLLILPGVMFLSAMWLDAYLADNSIPFDRTSTREE